MNVLRDPQILRGYLIERPFDGLPWISHCGEALCVRGHSLPAHRHPYFELLLLTGGRASWGVGRQELVQEVGDLLVSFPGQMHRTGSRPNPENQHLWIGVDLAALGPEGRSLGRQLLRQRRQLVPQCADLEPLLRGVIAQAISRPPEAEAVVRRYLELMVALLRQRVATAARGEPRAEPVPCSLPIQRCLAYLRAHLDRRLPLEEIARVGAMRNLTHFCTRFRREVGLAPAQLHRRWRLEAARDALRRADAAITPLAFQFGFSSSQHFSGAFRRAFGLSPIDWRGAAVGHSARAGDLKQVPGAKLVVAASRNGA